MGSKRQHDTYCSEYSCSDVCPVAHPEFIHHASGPECYGHAVRLIGMAVGTRAEPVEDWESEEAQERAADHYMAEAAVWAQLAVAAATVDAAPELEDARSWSAITRRGGPRL